MATVLNCVFGLLLTPEVEDPVDTDLAATWWSDRESYTKRIETHTKRFATSKTFAQLRLELVEDDECPEHLLCKSKKR